MSGSGSSSAFNIEAFIFNGHGEDYNPTKPQKQLAPKHKPTATSEGIPRFKLPENTYYVTVEECGNISTVNTSDILKSFNWRNPSFDKIPNTKDAVLMKELKDLFGIENVSNIHVHSSAPEDIGVVPNLFIPISVSRIEHEVDGPKGKKITRTTVLLDAAPGVIKRENLITADRVAKLNLLPRKYVGDDPTPEQTKDYGIVGRITEKLPTYYEYNSWPSKGFVQTIYDKYEKVFQKNKQLTPEQVIEETNKRTIEELEGKGRSVEDIIYELRDVIPKERPIVFYNPLCRFIEKPKGKTQLEKHEAAVALTQSSSLQQQRESVEEPEFSEEEEEATKKKTDTDGGRRRRRTYRRNKKLKRQTRRRR